MKLSIAWKAAVSSKAGYAVAQNRPERTRQIAHNLEAGNRQWESWLLQSGGELVAYSGNEGQALIPADRVAELRGVLDLYSRTVDAHGVVGVGKNPREAILALKAAEKRGGTQVVLYTPDIDEELNEKEEEDPLLQQPVAKSDSSAPAGEATKIQRGQLSPSAVQMPSVSSPSPAQMQDPQQTQQPQQSQDDVARLKRGVVQVLQQAKQLAPKLEAMKEQSPELYQTINASVQVMIEMARMLFGQQDQGPVQKSEKVEPVDKNVVAELANGLTPEAIDYAKEAVKHVAPRAIGAAKKVVGAVKQKLGKEEVAETEISPEETSMEESSTLEKEIVPEHHHLNLPVGSTKDGKVKIVHADGTEGWVSVRSGQALSLDGHAISSRNIGGR